jgi:hypothetical protein
MGYVEREVWLIFWVSTSPPVSPSPDEVSQERGKKRERGWCTDSPLIPPYEGGRELGTELPLYGLHGHPLPLVKGELERDFGGGKRRGKAHGLSR